MVGFALPQVPLLLAQVIGVVVLIMLARSGSSVFQTFPHEPWLPRTVGGVALSCAVLGGSALRHVVW
jgi:hypothetical protein